jgi:hypothetical protein
MRVSTLITALLPTTALAAYAADVSHTTSVATLTSTRTVVRVYTETHTGSPNSTAKSSGYWAKNSTATTTGEAKPAQSTLAVYSPGATGAAARSSFSVALAALAGTAAYVLL